MAGMAAAGIPAADTAALHTGLPAERMAVAPVVLPASAGVVLLLPEEVVLPLQGVVPQEPEEVVLPLQEVVPQEPVHRQDLHP